MKINQDKVAERFKYVKNEDRVYIYDGHLLIQFLEEKYERVEKYLIVTEIQPFAPLKKEYFITENGHKLTEKRLQEMYDEYVEWRKSKDYTTPIETRYRFMVMTDKLNLAKNGWQFLRTRKGVDQSIYISPAVRKPMT